VHGNGIEIQPSRRVITTPVIMAMFCSTMARPKPTRIGIV
jgi:hypothetical protein